MRRNQLNDHKQDGLIIVRILVGTSLKRNAVCVGALKSLAASSGATAHASFKKKWVKKNKIKDLAMSVGILV